jgi:hypothetical protein
MSEIGRQQSANSCRMEGNIGWHKAAVRLLM